MADLSEYYPVANQSPNGAGAPANPGVTGASGVPSSGATGDHARSPAFATLAILALAFFLLHQT